MESEKVKEIKKALENNIESHFYFINENKWWKRLRYADILTLINELESENERLKTSEFNSCQELDNAFSQIHSLEDRIAELEKENMILQGTKNRLTFTDRIKIADNVRTIALKQFAERLKEKIVSMKWAREDTNEKLIKQGATIKAINKTLNEFLKGE